MMEQVAFAVAATGLLVAGFQVVTGRNLVRSVLWLGAMLSFTALLFVFLRAPFLAGIQILLYAGGVVTLMLFGVMLTRRHTSVWIENQQGRRLGGAIVALMVFALLAVAITRPGALPQARGEPPTTDAIGRAFLTDHLLAFEVLSVLLLAAMIGAIVLARPRDHGAERAPFSHWGVD
jgi:NADH-quinone oxidoreductase subunit J